MSRALTTQVGPLAMPTPVGLASGTCGYGAELDGLVDWSAVGALFTKGLSLRPRPGHPGPRIWETPSGMLNAIGLENVGVERFVAEKMPFLRDLRERHGVRVIANVFGERVEDYGELAARLDDVDGVDGLELNLSCPNVKAGGIEFGRTPTGVAEVTRLVRSRSRLPLVVKLSPASSVPDATKAAADAGADAVSIGNTMPAMAIDVVRRVPRLAAGGGGLSGPALRPIAVRAIFEAARACPLPIIGVGGVGRWEDAAELLLAGASSVQVGTALFSDPNVARAICDGLSAYLERQQMKAVSELTGALEPPARWVDGGGA